VTGPSPRVVRNEEFTFSRSLFDTREQAIAWADEQRKNIEKGWTE
jgi:hypothetical protein